MIARLQCFCCDRDDWDSMIPGPGDTVLQMNPTAQVMRKAATKAGWRDISPLPPEPPESFNWATHFGICNECADDWFGVVEDAPSRFTEASDGSS